MSWTTTVTALEVAQNYVFCNVWPPCHQPRALPLLFATGANEGDGF